MATSNVEVLIQFISSGQETVAKSVSQLQKQLRGLLQVNAGLTATTGKALPMAQQQVGLIQAMGTAAGTTAQNLVKLRQEGSLFGKIFSGNSRQNVSQLMSQGYDFGLLSKEASTLKGRLQQELGMISVYTGNATNAFRDFTNVERLKVLGHVFSEEVTQMSNKLINWGKNLQWIGRQMIVGLTLPIVTFASSVTRSFLKINQAQTELKKYLLQTGLQGQALSDTMNELIPQFEEISKQTGLYTDEVTGLAAAWVAAGYKIDTGLVGLTDLTAKLNLITQGEIDMATATELVRSVQASWGLSLEETTDQVQKLTLVAGETSLTMPEIASALPLVSTGASLLGISASELAAALAGMREQGVQANAAANTLKFSFNRLIVPTDAAAEALKKFTGLNIGKVLFDEEGQGKGIEGLQDLARAFEDLTPKAQAILAGKLFGGYRADKMLKLIQALNDGTSQFATGLKDATDETRALDLWTEQLNIVQESSAQKFKVLRVELTTLAQKFGEQIFPYIEAFGEKLLNLLKSFENSPSYIKKFVIAIGAVLAAIGPVTFAVAQLAEAGGMLSRVFAAGPLRAVFSLKSREDPYGLQRIAQSAAGKKNPTIQLLAGLPVLNTEIATTTETAVVATEGLFAALKAEGYQVNQLAADYIRLNVARNAGFNLTPKDIPLLNKLVPLKSGIQPSELINTLSAGGYAADLFFKNIPNPRENGLDDAFDILTDRLKQTEVDTKEALKELGLRSAKFSEYVPEVPAVLSNVDELDNIIPPDLPRRVVTPAIPAKLPELKMYSTEFGRLLNADEQRVMIESIATRFGLSTGQVLEKIADGSINQLKRLPLATAETQAMLIKEIAARTGKAEKELAEMTAEQIAAFSSQAVTPTIAQKAIPTPQAEAAATLTGNTAEDIAQAAASQADDVAAAAAAATTTSLAPAVAQATTKAATEGVETGLKTALPATSNRIDDFIRGLGISFKNSKAWQFLKGSEVQAVATGMRGQLASIYNIAFGSPLKIVGVIGAALLLAKGLPDMIRGWRDEFEQIGKVLSDFVGKFVTGLAEIFRGGEEVSSTAEAFETVGDVIGKALLAATKMGTYIASQLLPVIRAVVQVATGAFTSLFDIIKAIVNFLTFNWTEAFRNVGQAINIVGQGTSVLIATVSKFVALIGGILLAAKAWSIFQGVIVGLTAAFGALSGVIQGAGVSGLFSGALFKGMGAGMTAAKGASDALGVSMISPWVTIPVLVGAAIIAIGEITSTMGTVDAAIQRNSANIVNSFNELGDAAKKAAEDSTNAFDFSNTVEQSIQALNTLAKTIAELRDEGFWGNLKADLTFDPSKMKDTFDVAKIEIAQFMLDEGNDLNGTLDLSNIVDRATLIEAMTLSPEEEQTIQNLIQSQLDDLKLTVPQFKEAKTSVEAELKDALENLKALYDLRQSNPDLVSEDQIREAAARIALLKEYLDELQFDGELFRRAKLEQEASKFDALVNKLKRRAGIGGKEVGDELGKAIKDELENQLSQLSSRVEDAAMASFEKMADARIDALDASSEKQLEQFDKQADAQIEAIQKQIDAIQKQNDKEEWLQQQREYRRQREELLNNLELQDAIAFAERLKAIHEGRYDDARIIELQALQQHEETNNQIRDLDQQHHDDVEQHKDDKAVAALERQKERLQKQLDAQKEALQKQLDAQKEALQNQIDNQRTLLQNMFEELQEFQPKNQRQWEIHYDKIKELARKFGVDVGDISAEYSLAWGQNIKQGLRDAIQDATDIATFGGGEIARGANNGLSAARAESFTQADIKLYQLIAEYLRAQADAKNGLDPTALAQWLDKIQVAMQEASKGAQVRVSGQTQAIQFALGHEGGYHGGRYHTGGKIRGNRPGQDVPITAQEGEFMFKRKAVRRWGLATLQQMNNEYHQGGYIQAALNPTLADTALVGAIPRAIALGEAGSSLAENTGSLLRGIGVSLGKTIVQSLQGRGAIPGEVGAFEGGDGEGKVTYNGVKITPATLNWVLKVKEAFAGKITPGYVPVIKFINGYSPPYSQHSYGNASDNFSSSSVPDAAKQSLWEWARKNWSALHLRNLIYNRQIASGGPNSVHPYSGLSTHENHVHADFNPTWTGNPYTGGYPVAHKGGFFDGKKFKQLGQGIRFEAPAILQRGETVLNRNVTNTLANAAQGSQDTHVTFEVVINGDFYGDDGAYTKLANTLERVSRKIARNRGTGNNVKINLGTF